MRKRILLVNQHTVPIFIDVANAFAETDCEIILFTGHIEAGGKPLSGGIKVVSSIRYNRKSSLTRMLTWLIFSMHYFFYLMLCRRPDRVLVVTNPPLAPFVTAFVSRWRGFAYYILLYDLYPEAFVQAGLMKAQDLLFRTWQNINRWMFNKATSIFTLSESMKNASLIYNQNSPAKIKVIHNWVDTEYIQPIAKADNPFVKLHNLEKKLVVLYSGNMGLTHDLESVINAAEILKNDHEIIFIMIGDGGKRPLLEKLMLTKGLTNVLFLPYQDSENFPLAMAAADVGVVTLGVGAEGISVPSKTYINMAAGVCILAIAPVNSELSRLIEEHQAGIICAPGNAQSVAHSLKNLLSNPSVLNQYRKNALEAAQHYTPENAKYYIREVLKD